MQVMNNSSDFPITILSTTDSGTWKERWETILQHPIDQPKDTLDWEVYNEYLLLRTKEYVEEMEHGQRL